MIKRIVAKMLSKSIRSPKKSRRYSHTKLIKKYAINPVATHEIKTIIGFILLFTGLFEVSATAFTSSYSISILKTFSSLSPI
jgi:hypothetical protein